MRTASWAAAVLAVGVPLVAQPPIRIVTLDATRGAPCQGMDVTFTGPFFTAARTALTSAANFGAGGIVPRAVTITAVPKLDVTALGSADVVLLTRVDALDAAEEMTLNSFLLKGGGLLWFQNEAASELGDLLGTAQGGLSGATAVVTNAASPLVNGPFGTLPVNTTLPHAYALSFTSVGRHGTTVMQSNNLDFAASFTLGNGRVAAFCDEEIFMSQSVSGCAAAQWSPSWQTVLLDTVAWLAPAGALSFGAADLRLVAYGSGCATGTSILPMATVLGLPTAGSFLRFTVRDGPPGAPAALLLGTQRVALPVLGCTVLVGISPVVASLHLSPMTATPPGHGQLELKVPVVASGAIVDVQGVVLDAAAANGVTTTQGAEVRF